MAEHRDPVGELREGKPQAGQAEVARHQDQALATEDELLVGQEQEEARRLILTHQAYLVAGHPLQPVLCTGIRKQRLARQG